MLLMTIKSQNGRRASSLNWRALWLKYIFYIPFLLFALHSSARARLHSPGIEYFFILISHSFASFWADFSSFDEYLMPQFSWNHPVTHFPFTRANRSRLPLSRSDAGMRYESKMCSHNDFSMTFIYISNVYLCASYSRTAQLLRLQTQPSSSSWARPSEAMANAFGRAKFTIVDCAMHHRLDLVESRRHLSLSGEHRSEIV